MEANITPIADFACHTGENPLWHPDEQCIYWCDIPQGRLFRFSPGTSRAERFDLGTALGGFTLQSDGALLLFMAEGAIREWRDGRVTRTVREEIPDERGNRFNDVIADPAGRVFGGVMSTPDRAGRLYRIDPDGTLTIMIENTGTANGMGFTPDHTGFYFTDTRRHTVSLFDYDLDSGAITNRRELIHEPASYEGENGGPDGMTIDAEGCIWSARWNGQALCRYSPDGVKRTSIPLPAMKVSSLTFGGPDYTDIYVTTAGGNDKQHNLAGAGCLYRIRTGVQGVPEFRSKL